jgi:hypothetical protein
MACELDSAKEAFAKIGPQTTIAELSVDGGARIIPEQSLMKSDRIAPGGTGGIKFENHTIDRVAVQPERNSW